MRVGGGVRLECTAPGVLTESQIEKREAALKGLRDDLLALGDHAKIRELMRGVALAPTPAAASLQEKLARRFVKDELKRIGPVGAGPRLVTFREFGLHWASGDFARANPDLGDPPTAETSRINLARIAYIINTIGHIPLARLTYEDAKAAMKPENLPKHCKSRTTRRHYAQIIQTVLARAVAPAGLIPVSPLPRDGWLPTIAPPPSHGIIYPNDDAMLMRGPVPMGRRILYGFEIREGLRLSHALRLRKRNIDFVNGMITVGKGKNNPDGRTWDLNRGVAAALGEYLKDVPLDGFVFPRLTDNEMLALAGQFREDLIVSGVNEDIRPDLFATGDGQEPVRFQDTRQSFVALHMAMDWPEGKIILRTQHKSSQVLHKNYGQKAAVARIIIAKQGPLLPLDQALGMISARVPDVWIEAAAAPLEQGAAASPRVGERVGVEMGAKMENPMIPSTPGRIRTYDQWIRNPDSCDLVQPDAQEPRVGEHETPGEDVRPQAAPAGWGKQDPLRAILDGGLKPPPKIEPPSTPAAAPAGPPLMLSKDALSRMLALATKDEDWDLAGALTAQLKALAAAAQPGVTNIADVRKRRGDGGCK